MNRQQIRQADRFGEESDTHYITFRLADGDFALEILRVQELRGWGQVTRIPNSPAHVRGLLNVRGAIVPVVDLRLCLSMSTRLCDRETVVIVVKVVAQGVEKRVGLLVDAAIGVLEAGHYQLRDTAHFGERVDKTLFAGQAVSGKKEYTLLNLDRLHPDASPVLQVDPPQERHSTSSNAGVNDLENQ